MGKIKTQSETLVTLQTKVAADEAEQVIKAAQKDLRSTSAWLRIAIIEKLERSKPKERQP